MQERRAAGGGGAWVAGTSASGKIAFCTSPNSFLRIPEASHVRSATCCSNSLLSWLSKGMYS